MRTLIDDLLTLSRLDEGLSGQSHAIDLSAMCERVLERLSSSPEAEGAIIEFKNAGPVEVEGSEPLVEQIVYNLVDNAIRYGDGKVEVSVETVGDSARLCVSDNGPGVPEELRARVFERFYRVDPSRSRETGGTGLGLAIVKHAVETMDGTIAVGESNLGGALFSVTLPVANAAL